MKIKLKLKLYEIIFCFLIFTWELCTFCGNIHHHPCVFPVIWTVTCVLITLLVNCQVKQERVFLLVLLSFDLFVSWLPTVCCCWNEVPVLVISLFSGCLSSLLPSTPILCSHRQIVKDPESEQSHFSLLGFAACLHYTRKNNTTIAKGT